MQQGRYAAKVIHSRVTGKRPPDSFSYFDKGSMAVVGKGFAVLQSGKVQVSGFGAGLRGQPCTSSFWRRRVLRLTVSPMDLDVRSLDKEVIG